MRKVAGFLFGYMGPGREKMRPGRGGVYERSESWMALLAVRDVSPSGNERHVVRAARYDAPNVLGEHALSLISAVGHTRRTIWD